MVSLKNLALLAIHRYGHLLQRADSLEGLMPTETPILWPADAKNLGKIEGGKRKG